MRKYLLSGTGLRFSRSFEHVISMTSKKKVQIQFSVLYTEIVAIFQSFKFF